MARYRNDFKERRNQPRKKVKKKFLIFSEGCVTEPEYFEMINQLTPDFIEVSCSLQKGKGLSPAEIVKRIESVIGKQIFLDRNDEVWAILDRDEWSDAQLRALVDWVKKHKGRGIGMSNPKFEFWLLLHFEKPAHGLTSNGCGDALLRHMPNYDKHIRTAIRKEQVLEAVQRAKNLDSPRCDFFPEQNGSTVYRLMERIFSDSFEEE